MYSINWEGYFVFNPKDSRIEICIGVYYCIVLILNFDTCNSSSADSKSRFHGGSLHSSSSSVISLKIRSVRTLDTIMCSGIALAVLSGLH